MTGQGSDPVEGGGRRGGSSASDIQQLRSMGITMLGVVISVGVTVAFGLTMAWWLRALIGLAVVVVLVAAIKTGTTAGSRGPVARAADWLTGTKEDEQVR